jgi:PhoPQ-activated pathogenicity-related protein
VVDVDGRSWADAVRDGVGSASAALEKYVRRSEPQFSWKLKDKVEVADSGDRIYELHLISQVWQGIRWQHQLHVYQPRDVRSNSTLFLWVTGGAARPGSISLGFELARQMRAPVAFLYHIPNQPLLEGKLFEDDLIAETFVRYLKTKDENWPLLFPMVKSVVKAMDVLQAFGKQEWGTPIHSFIVSGASKRGWTTWLAAAIDQRIRAIAPVAIDTLNMRDQMPRQLKAFGAYSPELAPYTKRGLLPIPETPEAEQLLNMVDPWGYRDRLAWRRRRYDLPASVTASDARASAHQGVPWVRHSAECLDTGGVERRHGSDASPTATGGGRTPGPSPPTLNRRADA